MKKNLLVSLCLGTVFAVVADANASSCQINSGAYAGISAGISNLSGSGEFNAKNHVAGFDNLIQPNKFSKTSAGAGLFAGYGMKFSGFWAAAELFYQFDRLNNVNKFKVISYVQDKKLQTNSTGAYGAAVHLGFVPSNNCIAYAILGAEVRNFKVKFSDSAHDIAATINKKYTSIAFTPGLGVRFSLTKNISVRTEYKYAMHRSKNITSSATNPNAGGSIDTLTLKNAPKIHSFNLGLVYSF
ncbi:MAG: outer membrane beta-barrel protein [Alphaproteobacteria bacterium]